MQDLNILYKIYNVLVIIFFNSLSLFIKRFFPQIQSQKINNPTVRPKFLVGSLSYR